MNGSAKKFLILAMLASSALLFGAGGRAAFSKVKVELKLEKPPVPNVNRALRNPSARVVSDPQWLVVMVTYTPQNPRTDGPVQDTYLDDVKMQLSVLFPLGNGNSELLGMFRGGQTLWTVCCDGRSHQAMMFVPPQLLQRYLRLYEGANGSRIQSSRGELKAEVVFFDRGERELGRGYCGLPGNPSRQSEAFGRFLSQVQPSCVIEGAFFERDATPWRCMAPEYFDLVKPEGLKLSDAPTPPRGNLTPRPPRRGDRTTVDKAKDGAVNVR